MTQTEYRNHTMTAADQSEFEQPVKAADERAAAASIPSFRDHALNYERIRREVEQEFGHGGEAKARALIAKHCPDHWSNYGNGALQLDAAISKEAKARIRREKL